MSIPSIFLVAVALAMDAFAVSVASGATITKLHLRHAVTIAFWFGGFQAIMPLVGWLGGLHLQQVAGHVDHWIAFGLLAFIGSKMIFESFKIEKVDSKIEGLRVRVLFVLAIATSIDALAVGISYAILHVGIVAPILIIGGVTFVMSFAGVWLGEKCGHLFEGKVEIVGGLILIGIGAKILISHVF